MIILVLLLLMFVCVLCRLRWVVLMLCVVLV